MLDSWAIGSNRELVFLPHSNDRSVLGHKMKGLTRRFLPEKHRTGRDDLRSSRRVKLPIPVRLKTGEGDFQERRIRDVAHSGLCVESVGVVPRGEPATLQFDGYPGVSQAFELHGRVARVTEEEPPSLGIQIDRQASSKEALQQYRKLVLHYLRHRPLLEQQLYGVFEGRCTSCEWIGRVSSKKPCCSVCGGSVVPVSSEASSSQARTY